MHVGDESRAEVRVIAPALVSRLRYWLSDDAEARRNAALRLAAGLESLCAAGIEAHGQVGDADPLLAIADALFHFDAEEIVIATQPLVALALADARPGRTGTAPLRRRESCMSSSSRARRRRPAPRHQRDGPRNAEDCRGRHLEGTGSTVHSTASGSKPMADEVATPAQTAPSGQPVGARDGRRGHRRVGPRTGTSAQLRDRGLPLLAPRTRPNRALRPRLGHRCERARRCCP